MKLNVIMPYRPITEGNFVSIHSEARQLEDDSWFQVDTGEVFREGEEYEKHRISIRQSIDCLNKLSAYRHKIWVAIDNDVYPNDTFLKEFPNVEIVKGDYVSTDIGFEAARTRLSYAMQSVIDRLPDDEWCCYGYQADFICAPIWDEYVAKAIEELGDDRVYTPVLVEGTWGKYPEYTGRKLTTDLLWRELREMARPYVTMPDPRADYITGDDFLHLVDVARSANMGNVIERCGTRDYGFCSNLCMKTEYMKRVGMQLDEWDACGYSFDNALWEKEQLEKVIVTDSYVWHPSCPHLEIREAY